jgi:uncharacterized protein with HEPN domain
MKNDSIYLEHVLGAIKDINEFIKDIGKEEFFNNKEKQYSVLRAFEIIGEASRKISLEFKKSHGDLPWKKMIAMRDKLIHDYFQVSLEIVWETIINDLPDLKSQLESLMDD